MKYGRVVVVKKGENFQPDNFFDKHSVSSSSHLRIVRHLQPLYNREVETYSSVWKTNCAKYSRCLQNTLALFNNFITFALFNNFITFARLAPYKDGCRMDLQNNVGAVYTRCVWEESAVL